MLTDITHLTLIVQRPLNVLNPTPTNAPPNAPTTGEGEAVEVVGEEFGFSLRLVFSSNQSNHVCFLSFIFVVYL